MPAAPVHRATIVAYAIAKMAQDVAEMKRAVDFRAIWNAQSTSAAMEQALALVAKEVHDVLVDPPAGIRNVTEWEKKQACWGRVQKLTLSWPQVFLDELISRAEQMGREREGRKDQKLLMGIEAQAAVVGAGGLLATGRGMGPRSETSL